MTIGDHGPYAATLHTRRGEPVGDVPCADMLSCSWSRELGETSQASIAVDASLSFTDDVVPWQSWLTIWDGQQPVWTGPVIKTTDDQSTLTVAARDAGVFLSRTRTPVSQHWAGETPQRIAADLMESMLSIHRVNVQPDVRPMDDAETFDYDTSEDATLLSENFDDLSKLGLRWTIVAGRPLFGDPSAEPVGELFDCDFMESTKVVRDGSRAANDVTVQGQNFAHTEQAELGDLRLQALVSIDDLFGVANIRRAARQYVKQTGVIRRQVVVPSSMTLAPDADVSLGDLVPGAVFVVNTRGIRQRMRLSKVEVSNEAGKHDVAVTLETVQETTILGELGAEVDSV